MMIRIENVLGKVFLKRPTEQLEIYILGKLMLFPRVTFILSIHFNVTLEDSMMRRNIYINIVIYIVLQLLFFLVILYLIHPQLWLLWLLFKMEIFHNKPLNET